MRTLEGKMVAKDIRIGIVCARFNEFITSKLLGGAMDGLLRHDVADENIDVAWVPGAFEIPLIAKKMAKSGKYDAVICLGAVIVVTTENIEQAIERAGTKAGNKGYDCALGAIEMVNLVRAID